MADETKAEQTTEKQSEQFIKCPCCGELTLRKPLDIKSAVLDEYMASIISGVPFQHTYTLYKQIEVAVTVLSKEDSRKVYTAVTLLDRFRTAIPTDQEELRAAVRELAATLQAYMWITSIIMTKDGKITNQLYPSEAMRKACDAILALESVICAYAVAPEKMHEAVAGIKKIHSEACQEAVLSTVPDVIIRAVTRTHIDLYNVLMDTGFDSNFWQGIELA